MADRGPNTPSPDPALRPMTVEDVAEVLALERLLFPHDAWPERFFREELAQAEPAAPAERATRAYWVAVVGGATEPGPDTEPGSDSDTDTEPGSDPDSDTGPGSEEAGLVVGYAGLMCVLPFADVQTLAVAPEAQGLGLGTRLLDTLIREARRRRAEQVLLEVRADNPGAQALYLRQGFAHIHTRPMYYPDGEDALIMQKLLTEQSR